MRFGLWLRSMLLVAWLLALSPSWPAQAVAQDEPAAETKAEETPAEKPAEVKPAEEKPAEEKPGEEKSADAPADKTEPVAAPAAVDQAVLDAEQARIEVVHKCSESTVAIFSPGGQGGGSGVLISADGYALSNFHVTSACGTAMQCGLNDGKLYDAVIVGLDPTGDVALIKLLGRSDFPAATLGDSDQVRVGDWCFTVGNPFLLATDFHPSVAYGVVSGVHRYQYPAGTILEYADCLQADAAINPGNSGGPMFSAEGKLIGINGRGSFEKRGRVNVGVGYAISINQIKNFLGHLKSGRLVDHATLGARVASDPDKRVIVDDILDESDAYRRGLRYGDEVVGFGGRSIGTVNAFKNALGIFPAGWRVPLSFVRSGDRFDVLVRLRGVHSETELEKMANSKPEAEPEHKPGEPIPGEPKPEEKPQDNKPDEGKPTPDKPKLPALRKVAKRVPLPEIVQKHFIAKPGYVNYHFNQVERGRVWSRLTERGDWSAWRDPWTLTGVTNMAEDFRLTLGDKQASIKLPSGELKIDLAGGLSKRLDPPGTGGLLVALSMWRRFLVEGPEKFGEVYYLGTVNVEGRDGLCDVLVGTYDDVECQLLFDPQTGSLVALEMYPEDDVDPCELSFAEFKEVEGRLLPMRITVRHGDEFAYTFDAKEYQLKSGNAPPAAEEKPAGAKPAAEKPVDEKPAEVQP